MEHTPPFGNGNLRPLLIVLFPALLFCACARTEMISVDDHFKGNLQLHLDLGFLISEETPETRALSGADFKVQIFKKGATTPVLSYARASELPPLIALTEGEYYVAASHGSDTVPAFEAPCYYGKSDLFTITGGETSAVSVTCKMASVCLTVGYSATVASYFSDYKTTVKNGTDSLVFAKGESRTGYFRPGTLKLRSELAYTAGNEPKTKTLTGSLAGAAAGKHYAVMVDTSPDEGDHSITVTVDEKVDTVTVSFTDEGASVPVDPGNGQLLITEIMYNPDAMNDSYGEWIEIYNNTAAPVNLKDLVIRKGGTTTTHQFATDVLIAPGGYSVIAKTDSATAQVDYVWSQLSLGNTEGDELIINTWGTDGTDGTVYCCIDFGAPGFSMNLTGKSLQLSPSVTDIEGARLGSNWCAATQPYSTGDLGTPGAANSPCP